MPAPTTQGPRSRVMLRNRSPYVDHVSVEVRDDDNPEGFPRQLVLTRDELQQLLQAAWDAYGMTAQPFHAEPPRRGGAQ